MEDRPKFHFQRLISELREANDAFDSGKPEKAYLMSCWIYQLVNDRGQNVSLATQCKLKDQLMFKETSQSGWGLAGLPTLSITTNGTHAQGCRASACKADENAALVDFSAWWERELINPYKPNAIQRKILVKIMRDQDGGSHVDQRISNSTYKQLAALGMPKVSYFETTEGLRISVGAGYGLTESTIHFVSSPPPVCAYSSNGLPLSPRDISGPFPIKNVIPTLMRQISGELLDAVDRLDPPFDSSK